MSLSHNSVHVCARVDKGTCVCTCVCLCVLPVCVSTFRGEMEVASQSGWIKGPR